MNIPIPEPVARLLAKAGPDLISDLISLIGNVLSSPNPKDAAARALQVTAHEQAADAAVEAMFAARHKIAGTGE